MTPLLTARTPSTSIWQWPTVFGAKDQPKGLQVAQLPTKLRSRMLSNRCAYRVFICPNSGIHENNEIELGDRSSSMLVRIYAGGDSEDDHSNLLYEGVYAPDMYIRESDKISRTFTETRSDTRIDNPNVQPKVPYPPCRLAQEIQMQ